MHILNKVSNFAASYHLPAMAPLCIKAMMLRFRPVLSPVIAPQTDADEPVAKM